MANLVEQRVYEIHVKGRGIDQEISNVLHYAFRNGGAGNPDNITMAEALTEFRNNRWVTDILPRLSEFYYVDEYIMRRVSQVVISNPGPPIVYKVSYDLSTSIFLGDPNGDKGLVVGPALPSYCAVTCRKISPIVSKSTRGSVRFALIPEASTEVGNQYNELTGAEKTNWETATANLEADIPFVGKAGTFDPVIFSRKLGIVETPPDEDSITDWTASAVNLFLGSQLSRKRPNRGN